jgi:Endonuclease NucS
MLERQMENLIAAFPEDFFPGRALALKGRQQSFAGVGRFDLLFSDRHGTNILMELKAVGAKYDNADQLAKYKEALEAQGERNIFMWLVAPNIPTAVREFLDRIGIEWSEIHEAEYRRVAERHGVSIVRDPSTDSVSRRTSTGTKRLASAERREADGYRMVPSVDKEKLTRLLLEFEAAVKRRTDRSLAARLRHETLEPAVPSISRSTMLQLARWCKTEGPPYQDGMVVAQKISEALFGEVLDRRRLGS